MKRSGSVIPCSLSHVLHVMKTYARPAVIRFGVFEVHPSAGELRRQGVKVRIHDQPLQLLLALLERPGEVVSRQEVRDRLWPQDTFVDFDNGLNNAIKRLRDALGDAADNPRFVETVPRRGYRFVAPVSAVADVVEMQEAPSPAPLALATPQSTRRWWPPLAVAVVLALVGTVAFWTPRVRPPAPGPIGSIAVLPLQNLSGDPSQEFFADGMTEALILELSRIKPLRVTSRTSAMHYRHTSRRAPEIARELGVDAIIEGSVQREGNRIRVTVQLIRAADDAHVWSNAYDRHLDSILSLHTDVGRAIAAEVHTTVMPESPATLAVRRIDPDVYLLYLRGRQLMTRQTEPELRQALKYFEQVAAAEPNFAGAHAAIARVWDVMAGAGSFVAPREAFPRVRAAARRALEIDPTFAEALALLAVVEELYEWRLDAAEAAYTHAIDVAPSNADVLERYSLHLARRLRRSEALEMAERAPSMAFFGYISSAAGFDPIRKHPRFNRIQQCAATSPAPE